MEIDRLRDVMQYYGINFMMVYILFVILVLAAMIGYKHREYVIYAFLFTTLGGIGFMFQMWFLGVLADNNAPNIQVMIGQLWILGFCAVVLWWIQLYMLVRHSRSKSQDVRKRER